MQLRVFLQAHRDLAGSSMSQPIIDGFLSNSVKLCGQLIVIEQNGLRAMKITADVMQLSDTSGQIRECSHQSVATDINRGQSPDHGSDLVLQALIASLVFRMVTSSLAIHELEESESDSLLVDSSRNAI